jgi:hypothetical protein
VPDVEDVVILLVFLGEVGKVLGGEVGLRTEGFRLVSHFNEIIIGGEWTNNKKG